MPTKPKPMTIEDLGPARLRVMYERAIDVLEEALESDDERIRLTAAKHIETLGRRVLAVEAKQGGKVKPAPVSASAARGMLRIVS